jgi:hypothetical protein
MDGFKLRTIAWWWCLGLMLGAAAGLFAYHLRDVFAGAVYCTSGIHSDRPYTWSATPWRFVFEVVFQSVLGVLFAFTSLGMFYLGIMGFRVNKIVCEVNDIMSTVETSSATPPTPKDDQPRA